MSVNEAIKWLERQGEWTPHFKEFYAMLREAKEIIKDGGSGNPEWHKRKERWLRE